MRARYLCLKLRDLQHCERLTLTDPVPYIDVDVADIAGDFAMNIDLLKGLENPSYGKLICNETTVCRCDRDGRRGSGNFPSCIGFPMSVDDVGNYAYG